MMKTKCREIITNSAILAFLALLVFYVLTPNYKHSIDGVFSGFDFELSMKRGTEMGNYYLTELEGGYGPISISDTLPPQNACIYKGSIKRVSGIITYGEIRDESMARMGKKEMDQCIIMISKYFDDRYSSQAINYNSFNS